MIFLKYQNGIKETALRMLLGISCDIFQVRQNVAD